MEDAHDYLITNLRALTKQRGITLTLLADRAGVARGAMTNITKKLHSPTLATLQRLATALELDVAELVRPPKVDAGQAAAVVDVHGKDGKLER